MERRATVDDYHWIRTSMVAYADKLKRSGRKLWYQHIDVDEAIACLFKQHAYILDESLLVVYDIVNPWYAKHDVWLLQEVIVLRLAVSGTDFSVVPAFLERKAREAGCVMAVVGTALAKADTALASVYSRFGYQHETSILVKEP